MEEYCLYLGNLVFFISYRQKIKRIGKRQERRRRLNIYGWVHLSSLRIKVTLAVFSGLHEQDNNKIYVYLGKQL